MSNTTKNVMLWAIAPGAVITLIWLALGPSAIALWLILSAIAAPIIASAIAADEAFDSDFDEDPLRENRSEEDD